jgi:hypothetical protein
MNREADAMSHIDGQAGINFFLSGSQPYDRELQRHELPSAFLKQNYFLCTT